MYGFDSKENHEKTDNKKENIVVNKQLHIKKIKSIKMRQLSNILWKKGRETLIDAQKVQNALNSIL